MEIRDNNIFRVCQIPNLPMDHWSCFYGKLFSLDNTLYMCNCKQIFKLVNNEPQFVMDAKNSRYF